MKNLIMIMLLLASLPLTAVEADAAGKVTLPLDEYQRLLEAAKVEPTAVPSRYAIGQAELNIQFHQHDTRVTATVRDSCDRRGKIVLETATP